MQRCSSATGALHNPVNRPEGLETRIRIGHTLPQRCGNWGPPGVTGVRVAFRRFLLGSGLGATAIALAGAAIGAAPHATPIDPQLLSDLGAPDDVEFASVVATAFLPPDAGAKIASTSAHLAQEGKAAGLFTGRDFLARGRTDERVQDVKFVATSSELPEGWRDDGQTILHLESGLKCAKEITFDKTATTPNRRLSLSNVTQYDQRGRDVSCNFAFDGDAAITLYASFYPDIKIEDHAASAVAAIHQSFNVKGPLPVAVVEISRKEKDGTTRRYPAPLAAGFDVGEVNGVPYKTSVWLAETHGWHVKARATYARSDMQAEIVASLLFGVTYISIDMKNVENPTAAGAEV